MKELNIRDRIHVIRGFHVMLDEDLAELYNVETGALNQAVRRNIERFPGNFMFQLSTDELENLKSQIVISSWGGRRKLPYVFTEQGVAMLSGVLKSDIAIKISIQIMNAFVSMRKIIAANADLYQRVNTVERKLLDHDDKFEQVFDAIQGEQLPDKGIFYDGQVFDSYVFVSDLIKSAKKSIVLIDNYIDESVLLLLTKRNIDVNATIFTRDISNQLILDIKKHNSQYPKIDIKEFKDSHDRFLIIDDTIYHFGASLKDLGNKWFAFSKFEKDSFKLMDRLELN